MRASPSAVDRYAGSMFGWRLGDMQPPVETMIEQSTRSKGPPDCCLYWPRVTKASEHERQRGEYPLHT